MREGDKERENGAKGQIPTNDGNDGHDGRTAKHTAKAHLVHGRSRVHKSCLHGCDGSILLWTDEKFNDFSSTVDGDIESRDDGRMRRTQGMKTQPAGGREGGLSS